MFQTVFRERFLIPFLLLVTCMHQPLQAAPVQLAAAPHAPAALLAVDPALAALQAQAVEKFLAHDFEESTRLFEELWGRVRLGKNKRSQAEVLTLMSMIYYPVDPNKTFAWSEQALPLLRELGYLEYEAMLLTLRAAHLQNRGQPHEALQAFNRAIEVSIELKDKGLEAAALVGISTIFSATGQHKRALESLHQALLIYRELDEKSKEATTLVQIGEVYHDIGDSMQAVRYFLKAWPLIEKFGSKMDLADMLSITGDLFQEINEPQQAIEHYNQALVILRELKLDEREATTLVRIGCTYQSLKQPQQALATLQQALSIFRRLGHRQSIGITLFSIGQVYDDMGQSQQALTFYSQTLSFSREAGRKELEATTLLSTAIIEERQGQLAAAITHAREALMIVEGVRESLGGFTGLKVTFLEKKLFYYHFYIELLLRQGNVNEAFTWVEKTKARALLDLMYDGKVNLAQGIGLAERQQEQQLKQRVSQLNQGLVTDASQSTADPARFAGIKQQLAAAESALQQFMDQLYASQPDLARKHAARTITKDELAALLPADTALLDYLQLPANIGQKSLNKTYLFCATVENGQIAVKVYPLKADNTALQELTEDFRAACTDATKSYRVKAHDLHNLLIAPAEPQLKGRQRLLICPDGLLWGLPFQALMSKAGQAGASRFLAEQYEVNYAYSATAAQAALASKADPNRKQPAQTLLALANPDFGGPERLVGESAAVIARPIGADSRPIGADARATEDETRPIGADARPIGADARGVFTRDGAIKPLPGTQFEADALKASFPNASVNLGMKAQESVAKQQGSQYRYLHFATHGLWNETAPLLSSIVLAQPLPSSKEDGFLMAREIFDLNWNADMAVLSACNTARGEKRSGEGVIGLTWALFVAGVPTQVVSQWAVNDTSTAELMKHFYGHLKKGAAKGAALRSAELSLMQDGQHSHPYYWAPFILTGDWGK